MTNELTQTDTGFVTREHPEYVQSRQNRCMYRDLYAGGERFKANASNYLVRRHKEPNDIFFERLSRVFYENYIGSIVDWFTASLFRREPIIQFAGTDQRGKGFFDQFIEDCDRRGTTLAGFYRRQITQALVDGKSYIGIDFPRIDAPVYSRGQEDAAGISRAYLVEYSADEVINWSRDEIGALDWIVIRSSGVNQANVRDAHWGKRTRWLYYDRERFELYESKSDSAGTHGRPELVATGPHALAAQKRVPVFEVQVSDGLWLMNKASLLQIEHFNKSNALAWALTMGLFAMPVIYSDREFTQIVGDSYFIQLGPQDRFGWTEPSGNVFQTASENLERLKEEIYRVCYMSSQAGSTDGGGVKQSGVSKAYDFSVTQEILRTYGDVVKESMQAVLEAVAAARQDGLEIDVTGLDEFDIQDFGSELQDAQSLLALNIPSETVKKQLFKRIALKYFSDAKQAIKTTIADEIDQAFAKE